MTLWSGITKNPDKSTGSLAHPIAHSLAPFTCLLTHSQACGKVNDWMAIFDVFLSVLDHSAIEEVRFQVENRYSWALPTFHLDQRGKVKGECSIKQSQVDFLIPSSSCFLYTFFYSCYTYSPFIVLFMGRFNRTHIVVADFLTQKKSVPGSIFSIPT